MRKKRHTPEEIIRKLREAEVALGQGSGIMPPAAKDEVARLTSLGNGGCPAGWAVAR